MSSFTQISKSLESAAQVFGGSPLYIFRLVTLPLIMKGVPFRLRACVPGIRVR